MHISTHKTTKIAKERRQTVVRQHEVVYYRHLIVLDKVD